MSYIMYITYINNARDTKQIEQNIPVNFINNSSSQKISENIHLAVRMRSKEKINKADDQYRLKFGTERVNARSKV